MDLENAYSSSNMEYFSQTQNLIKGHKDGNSKTRDEHNNSSPNNKPKQGQGQTLVYREQMRLKTHNYFHPDPKTRILNDDLSKIIDNDSPRFHDEGSRHNESSKSFPGLPRAAHKDSNSYRTNGKDDITEYTKEEMHNFKTVFNTFDKNKRGRVSIEDLYSIFQSLRRSPSELEEILSELGLAQLQPHDWITFDQFVVIMQKLENEMDKGQEDEEEEVEVYSRKLEQEQFGEVERDMKNGDLRRDFTEGMKGQHYYTAGEDEQEEPRPALYEVVDDEGEEAQEQDQEQYHEPDYHEVHRQQQMSENPIPESDSVDEQEDETQQRSHTVPQTDDEALPREATEAKTEDSSVYSFRMPRSPSSKERKIYGAMLPKHGVYFLPDLKVIDFIRVLNNYKRKCLKEGKLSEVKKSKTKINELRNKEMLRQLTNMCVSHEKEVETVERAQKKQFTEFETAWDSYMMEYEEAAQKSIKKLQKQHEKELKSLQRMMERDPNFKVVFSQDLIGLR
jgi:Ca2+-binding EF-hand superfamily protein